MRIAVIGTGRMGKAIEEVANMRGWEVCARFNTSRPLSSIGNGGQLGGVGAGAGTVVGAGVDAVVGAVIDFSSPLVFEEHVRRCTELGFPLVVGTTGFGDRIETMRRYVEDRGGSVLYSPNFSLGIAILRRALRVSLQLVSKLDGYDVSVHEVHHAAKRDRPSGTALLLAQDIRDAAPSRYPLDVSSSRVGSVVGEHTVRFDGPDDQIILHHSAKSRRGFAVGALEAAKWLSGKTGFFTLDDMLDEWVC